MIKKIQYLSAKPSISTVFPAYNEEENIEKTINSAMDNLPKFSSKYEIIIVNDGSTDKTGDILNRLSGDNKFLKVIHHEKNKGYGAALKSGITSASCDLIFFCDSDLQFNIEEIEKLLQWIDKYDMVLGYRAKRSDPFIRKFNAFGWKCLVGLMLGLNVKDIDCAFKIFHKKVFDNIKIDAVGAMVNTDILVQAVANNFTIKEVPVTHFPRANGEQTGANFKVILKAFVELFFLYSKLNIIKEKRHEESAFAAEEFVGMR